MSESSPPALFSSIPEAFVKFDNSFQYGENGNVEYRWSTYFQEKIVQLSFQLTRTHSMEQKKVIGDTYSSLLNEAFMSTTIDSLTRQTYISILYRLMLHTRDIIEGKGEYGLFYILLSEWVKLSETLKAIYIKDNDANKNHISKISCIETLTEKAVEALISLETFDHPYGCWKDMKYLLHYLRTRKDIAKNVFNLPIFKHVIAIIVKQLAKDATGLHPPSLLAKWLPREKSKKFGWIAKHIACQYYSHWLITNSTSVTTKDKSRIILSNKYSERKCLTRYRQLIADLNRTLHTIQINQCNHTWQDIDFESQVTSITMSRQKNAFQYKNKKDELYGLNPDRLICKANYETYIKKCMMGEMSIKGKRTDIINLVKDALEIVDMELRLKKYQGQNYAENEIDKTSRDTINLQWAESGKEMSALEYCIPLIDTSGSMEGEPLHAALGLGCRIAENSRLGKRAITFSATPSWVDLSECDTLIKMVEKLATNKEWGMNTNFVAALQLIADACIEQDLTPDQVGNLTLVVFSDMQIDEADKNSNTMHSVIEKMFNDTGIHSKYATAFKVPRIIYWNLRSTSGFPVLSCMNNVSMLSGFSPVIMNSICERGSEGLRDCTPWEMLKLQLNNKRYTWIDETLDNVELFTDISLLNETAEDVTIDPVKPNTTGWNGWW